MTQQDLFQTATSSQPDTLASHLVRPGSDEARKMTAISGRKYLPLCKQNSPVGLFAKMWLDTSVWASTKCYLTWKAKVTPSNRLLFQLAPSMPRTDAIESGSLLHTPTAKANQMSPDMVKKGSGWWATPNTLDHLPQRSAEALKKQATSQRKGRTRPANLREQVNPETVEAWNVAQQSGQPKMWPTPDASDRGPRSADLVVNQSTVQRRDSGQKRGMDLQTAAKFFPTPTANEDAAGTPNGKMQAMLGNHPDVRGTTPEEWKQGSLSPLWVEWLMGYPRGWTDLTDGSESQPTSQE